MGRASSPSAPGSRRSTTPARGDDYTGLLAVPAAPALLAIGAIELWRSRRTGDSPWWRYPRRGLIAVAGALAGCLVAVAGYGYSTTHVAPAVVPAARRGVPHEPAPMSSSTSPPTGPRSPPSSPTLLISAGTDVERDFNVLYDHAARGPVEHWNLPAADHTRAIRQHGSEYERRVVSFLDAALAA